MLVLCFYQVIEIFSQSCFLKEIIINNALYKIHINLMQANAVKFNLKELTTKSAWVPRSAVFSMRMSSGWLHQSCDSSARSVFPSCWVLSAIFFPSRPSPRPVRFFLHWCFSQCDGCLFLSFGVVAHGWVALLCQSWGHYFNLGASCK